MQSKQNMKSKTRVAMKKIILASSNEHKVEEIRKMLSGDEVFSLADIGFLGDIVEDGSTFLDYSTIKVKAVQKFLKKQGKNNDCYIIADDSGLCVDALNGAPGIFSARFGGDHDFVKNRKKLLDELEGKDNKNAHFECCITLIEPNGKLSSFVGRCFGKILAEEVGDKSFGYNCLFYSTELKKAFGLASIDERNSVSHRGKAMQKLKEYLKTI